MPSAKVLEQKQQIVSELASAFKSAQTMVVADYRGLTVAEDTELRQAMRNAGVTYAVVKNSMATLAVREANLEGMEDLFKGPTAIAYSAEDPIAPAKVLKDFAKKFKLLEIKGGAYNGEYADQATLERLASIPSRETLLSQLVFMLNAPITGLARGLSEIQKKKESEEGTPAEAASEAAPATETAEAAVETATEATAE